MMLDEETAQRIMVPGFMLFIVVISKLGIMVCPCPIADAGGALSSGKSREQMNDLHHENYLCSSTNA